jgi:putative FmdB family regulatory protein
MPVYEYRCKACGFEFSATHSIDAELPECPECESADVQRVITSAPAIARGMLTHAGDSRRSSQEQLRSKWAEETPKLRRKLRDKLGEDAIRQIPSLNSDFE